MLFCQSVHAQLSGEGLQIGFGYKSEISTFGFGATAYFEKNLELKISTSARFTGGFGFTTGIQYNFFTEKKVFPDIGFSYRFIFPCKPDIGYDNDTKIVLYSVPFSNAVFPHFGVNLTPDNERIFAINLGYLIPLNNVTASYISGTPADAIKKQIENNYRKGVCCSLIYTIKSQRKKGNNK